MRAEEASSSAAREGELVGGGGQARIGASASSPPVQPRPLPSPLPSSSDQQQQQQQQQQQPPHLLLAQLTTVQHARDLASAVAATAGPGRGPLIAPGRLFRSACPAGCSERDVSILRKGLKIRTLLDLRSDEERRQDPRCLLLHSEGNEVSAFDRAGVGAAPSSSSSSSTAVVGGEGAGAAASSSASASSVSSFARKPVHRPTLPLGPVPADDPAPPLPGEPPLVVHHISLLDKKRFRKALISEGMPKRNAAAVVALGLLARAASPVSGSLSSGLAEKSRELAMAKINQGEYIYTKAFLFFFVFFVCFFEEREGKTHSSLSFSLVFPLSLFHIFSEKKNIPGGLSNMYHCLLESSDAEIGAALRALLSSAERGAPALFFCRAGKDRTGLVAALVLSICGADDESILDDYVLSDDPRAEEIALGGMEKSRDLQGLDTRVFARAPREALENALRGLRSRHGSVEKYLQRRCGFSLAEQARLRAALAVERPTPSM